MGSEVIVVSTVLGTLGLAFGVTALRAWLESKKQQSINQIIKTLVNDPYFRKELIRQLRHVIEHEQAKHADSAVKQSRKRKRKH